MKPKEYIDKFSLQKGWNSKFQSKFLQDITLDFTSILERNQVEDSIVGFNNSVKELKTKWDSISAKICGGLPQSLWNYFFATVVVPAREELCPTEMKRRQRIAEERKAAYERRKAEREEMDSWLREAVEAFWEESFKERLLFLSIMLDSCPTSSFLYMNLCTSATPDQVKSRFREMAKEMHPDKGGSEEDFKALLDHKNKCLKWSHDHTTHGQEI